jgi:hypothetical protein
MDGLLLVVTVEEDLVAGARNTRFLRFLEVFVPKLAAEPFHQGQRKALLQHLQHCCILQQ